jgi:hypothetical protein
MAEYSPAESHQFSYHCFYTELMKRGTGGFTEIIKRFLAMQQKFVT